MTVIVGQVVDPGAQVGHCLIGVGNNTWKLYSAQTTASMNFYSGCAVGVLLSIPGVNGTANVQISGAIDPTVFSLGGGGAGPVYASTFPIRGVSGLSPIGTCDISGTVALSGNIVGTAGPGPIGPAGPAGPTGPAGPGGGGGGGGITNSSFTQPAVWTVAAPTVLLVAFSSTTGMAAGLGLTILGGGSYVVSSVPDGTHANILNTGGNGSVAPGLSVAASTVTITSAPNLLFVGAPLSGQAYHTIGGTSTPLTGTVPLYFTDLASKLPDNTRQVIHVDAYASDRPHGGGSFRWRTTMHGTSPGTVAVTNGSTAITFTNGQIARGSCNFVFASQPGVTYFLAAPLVGATAGTLTTPYTGTTNAATTCQFGRPDDGGTKVTPTGYTGPGWWERAMSQDAPYRTADFGAYCDGSTDDYATIQGVYDCNVSGSGVPIRPVYLTPHGPPLSSVDGIPKPAYALSAPLVQNDYSSAVTSALGNSTAEVYGPGKSQLTLCRTSGEGIPRSTIPNWLGPQVQIGRANFNSSFVTESYGGNSFQSLVLGDSIQDSTLQPAALCLNHEYLGDLTLPGALNKSWELEFFYNPLATVAGPGFGDTHIANIYGKINNPDLFATRLKLSRFCDGAGHSYVLATVTTTAGSYSVSGSASGPGGTNLDLAANTVSCISLAFDSTNNLFTLRINGSTGVGGGLSVAMTAGAQIVMDWYSDFILGSAMRQNWPRGGSVVNTLGGTVRLGKTHLTRGAVRHTANYTPNPTAMVADGKTAYLFDFARVPTRPGLAAYTIAKCGFNSAGQAWANGPIDYYFDMTISGNPETQNAKFRGVFVCGQPGGTAIVCSAATNTQLSDLKICSFHGVEFRNFSYLSSMDDTIFIQMCNAYNPGTPNAFHSWDYLLGDGAQFIHIGKGVKCQEFGNAVNWHGVITYGANQIDTADIGYANVGTYALVNQCGSLIINNNTCDDENHIQTYAIILAATCDNLTINGGLYFNGTNIPLLKVGAGCLVSINGAVPVSPVVSFYSDQNNGIPIMYNTKPTTSVFSTALVVDAAHPGPVVLPFQEMFGSKSIALPDADYALPAGSANDQLWGNITFTGTLTAARTFRQANFNIGKRTAFTNATTGGFAVTVAGPSGAGVSVAAGTVKRVKDTGSNTLGIVIDQ